jgi:hypothetical protein
MLALIDVSESTHISEVGGPLILVMINQELHERKVAAPI